MIKIHPATDLLRARGQCKGQSDPNEALLQGDAAFDWLYPEHIEAKSRKHWSPLDVIGKAAQYLAEPDTRVLDIGSGVGKLCLASAYYKPNAWYYGVEQRKSLVYNAETARQNASIICSQSMHDDGVSTHQLSGSMILMLDRFEIDAETRNIVKTNI